MEYLKKPISGKIAFGVIGALSAVFVLFLFAVMLGQKDLPFTPPLARPSPTPGASIQPILSGDVLKTRGVAQFVSEKDFKEYLQAIDTTVAYGGGFARTLTGTPREIFAPDAKASNQEPQRVSETNVQVQGIDEPDIVKTDGKEIYFSPGFSYYAFREPMPLILPEATSKSIYPPPYKQPETKVVKAFPPSALKIDSEIEDTGNLLLSKNTLVVFSGTAIHGYDVLNPLSPKKQWTLDLDDNTALVDARLYAGKLYMVTQEYINHAKPCPIEPLILERSNGVSQSVVIPCADIYYPIVPVPADVTFVAMAVDPLSGEVEHKLSFVGSSGSSVISMSSNAMYASYSFYESTVAFVADFFNAKASDLIPSEIRAKIAKLESYDISQQSKLNELQLILQGYMNSLDNDERLRVENELTNRFGDYYKENKRKFEKTSIVKIGLQNFGIVAVGNVPGRLINQFALDEYQDNLRVATTVGEGFGLGFWFGFGIGGSSESVNDVYVLDRDLQIQGSVQDLALGERIYSVRFVADKGYVVTFRQIDPFFVLDLANPQKPELKGELKIPGFSSYLHPISKDRVLGVGQENWRVKLSLFDVSDPANPKEVAKYTLDESWSEVSSTHHAFLLDDKHGIFFLPGGSGGFIFSYKGDKLELVKAVSETGVRRAIYLDDYLYIIGDQGITVWDEISWNKVNELEF